MERTPAIDATTIYVSEKGKFGNDYIHVVVGKRRWYGEIISTEGYTITVYWWPKWYEYTMRFWWWLCRIWSRIRQFAAELAKELEKL